MDFMQLLGTISPALAPTLLIAYFSIRLILEFLKERRETEEAHRLERKEWKESSEALAHQIREEYNKLIANYHNSIVETVAIGRDITNQMHTLKNEIQKMLLELGRKASGGGSN